MADYKQLIPSFGCREKQAIIKDYGLDYFSNDILTLASYYSDNGADELLISDLSETDERSRSNDRSIRKRSGQNH